MGERTMYNEERGRERRERERERERVCLCVVKKEPK